ncbi:hypothetical protein PFLUV_G00173620 [Perca fluviatilis]|uniref:Uncharacterized protein n=1 Tax=Perca fluviatilis TaxID=8168 RepID=A0A6A5EXL1_PERFL|nr:hypothetical protein PFLUV_G00173620 [Perca fluviatilis]
MVLTLNHAPFSDKNIISHKPLIRLEIPDNPRGIQQKRRSTSHARTSVTIELGPENIVTHLSTKKRQPATCCPSLQGAFTMVTLKESYTLQ